MIGQKIKKISLIFLAFVLIALFLCAFGCEESSDSRTYIVDNESFTKAIQIGQKTIYIGDISFESQTEVKINYPVEIIGKDEKSKLENVHFIINGTNVATEDMPISFRNIIFDGKVKKTDIQLVENKTFDEIVGDKPQYRCIDGCVGYFSLSLENCEIKNYLHEEGPAIYINNDTKYKTGQKALNLLNCNIYDNICNLGTVKVFSDVLTTKIDNCNFFGNLARAGQGIAIGNGKSTIANTIVHDNDFFRFVNSMERKFPTIFHDDKQTYKGITTNALGGCCGAIFIGGSHTIIDNCKIYNNKTIFGGGIGIINASTLERDEKVDIKNTDIKNNTALLCGGGIYLESNQGETTYFTNCNILGNSVGERGSVIYTTTYSPDNNKSYGGNVQFAFCTMAENKATDTNTFNFYDLLKSELAGIISLKGCFVLSNDTYNQSGEEYNYIATKEQALLDDVITEEDVANINEKGINPKSRSKGDVKVPASVYSTWVDCYKDATSERGIGYLVLSSNSSFPYWVIAIIVVGVAIVVVVIVLIVKRKKKYHNEAYKTCEKDKVIEAEENIIDYSEYSFEDIYNRVQKLYGEILTKKELEVATYVLYDNSRKEIAQKLIVSDETVKSHLSNIFKKTGVSSKAEFKKITEKKIFGEQI